MACFIECLGMPPNSLTDRAQRKRIFFDSKNEPRQMTNSRGRRRRVNGRSLDRAIGCQDTLFLDFIRRCFEWEPDMRLTPLQAIRHDWIRRRKPPPPPESTQPSQHMSAQPSQSSYQSQNP